MGYWHVNKIIAAPEPTRLIFRLSCAYAHFSIETNQIVDAAITRVSHSFFRKIYTLPQITYLAEAVLPNSQSYSSHEDKELTIQTEQSTTKSPKKQLTNKTEIKGPKNMA
jgi:hypothetical protein